MSPTAAMNKTDSDHSELSRQMTVQLSSEQYERLFLQPQAAKGDLAKRLGNPTLLGLIGFLIPLSTTVFCLLQFQGSSTASLTSISGSTYFIGGIAMNVASIAEFILGNTFPFAVFMTFGCHWINLGYIADPLHGIVASYTADGVPGALSQGHNAGQGNYNVVMAIVCFIFTIGSLRTNVPLVVLFFTLIFLFSFVAAADYQLGFNPSAAGVEHATYYFKIAGGFGFVTMLMGWYLAILATCASTGVPCPLPDFNLSQKVFPDGTNAQMTEHAGARVENHA
ncbi:Protein alcS [Lachnellula suecica]|uniref:Protein alcS n=1 Tax=Lachnellula suecica TaxID=602035 RepID=A0A8T9C8N0_9HELO|nr:Protein alcS [Lachnellula suecica]